MFKIISDRESKIVSIGYPNDTILDGFLDIYVETEDEKSPFKNIESAELFAEIILKLMEAVLK